MPAQLVSVQLAETGMDGLEEQRENASQRLNAAKLDAKAALTVAKAEGATGSDGENLDSIDGGEANKQAAAKVESMKIKKATDEAAANLAASGGAGAATVKSATGSSEKGITIRADNDDDEDADMENTAKAEKDGIKTGLSPTEKTAMEASRAAMQARLKEAEDKWSVQVSKFNNALDEEKTTCASAKAAALAAQALEKKEERIAIKVA